MTDNNKLLNIEKLATTDSNSAKILAFGILKFTLM